MKRSIFVLFALFALLLSSVAGVFAQEGEEEAVELDTYDGRYTFDVPEGYTLNESLTQDIVRVESEDGTIIVVGPVAYANIIGAVEQEDDAAYLAFYAERTGYTVGEPVETDAAQAAVEVELSRRDTAGTAYLVDLQNNRTGVVISLGNSDDAVDNVLASLTYPADIVDVAVNADNFVTLVTAVQAAGLETALRNDEVTVFAPTDLAFEAALDELGLTADELLASDQLATILQYHVVEGIVTVPTELDTLAGESLTFSVGINDSVNVVEANLEAFNGVIHVIDTVLVPQSVLDALAAAEATEEATDEMVEEATEEATEESE